MAKKPVVLLFSGQGSQSYHMGLELFERHATFRRELLAMDGMAKDMLRASVLEALYDPQRKKTEAFDRTLLTHPAIYMVEVALARTLVHEGITPNYVLGTSLGAFAAATTAGVISAEDGLRAVIEQAKLIDAHCAPGTMVAILDQPSKYSQHAVLHENSEIASFNFPSHFVVAALRDRLTDIEQFLRTSNVTFQSLPVTRAFHSRWIDPAESAYTAFLRDVPLRTAAIPFVCCLRGGVRNELEQNYFWNVAREPIRFQETFVNLEQSGSYAYIDAGPAGTLATFAKYNLSSRPSSAVYPILTPFGQDLKGLQRALDALRANH